MDEEKMMPVSDLTIFGLVLQQEDPRAGVKNKKKPKSECRMARGPVGQLVSGL